MSNIPIDEACDGNQLDALGVGGNCEADVDADGMMAWMTVLEA